MVETTNENQITSPFHIFKPYLLCVSILVPSIVFTSFLGLGFPVTLFTTAILILSTSFLVKFSKKTKLQVEDEEEDEVDQKEIPKQPLVLMNNTVSEADDNDIVNEFQVDEPLDSTSESDDSSDDSGSSSLNLEMSWMISGGNMEQNPEISDEYSTSEDDYDDEEGLIEIALPSNDHSKFSTFLPESILQQQDLVELLGRINEVTEEENLIEIDISMGSIKCPSFEIEA